jgi:hypothetical protein
MCSYWIQATVILHNGGEVNVNWKHDKLCESEYATHQITLQPSKNGTNVSRQAMVSATAT